MPFVLFVDEIRDDRGKLAVDPVINTLKIAGHRASACASIDELETILAGQAPEVLVVGLVLLRTSAEEVLRVLRQHPTGCRARVIVITSEMAEGGPWRDWSWPVDAFVCGRGDANLLLSIERVLYRALNSSAPPG